jgi:general secretion pathway protein A
MYIEHFGLTAQPFSLTPDPAFLYLGPAHREALAAIEYSLVDGRGYATLVGEVGTGKTTILYSLLSRLAGTVQVAYVAYTRQSFEDLLVAVLRDLGIAPPTNSKPAMLQALNEHLWRRSEEGGTTALVIDEAQNLSDDVCEELRLLSNFETFTHKLLQIVLVGQPELQDLLRRPQLRQLRERVSVRAIVNPLSAEEMERYIDHRLRLVGASVGALFAPRALAAIIRRTEGIPRRANILCHNALLFAYGRGLGQVSQEVATEAIAEMDERRPGLFRRETLRRTLTAGRVARWLSTGALTAAVVVGAARRPPSLSPVPEDLGVPLAAAPNAEEAAPPAGVAESDPRTAAALPAAVPSPEFRPFEAGLQREALKNALEAFREPPLPEPVAAAPPAPAAAPERASAMTLIIPVGATLRELVHDLYGADLKSGRLSNILAQIERLNPGIDDLRTVAPGQSLRVPPLPGEEG